ncbi:MAG: DNA-3-methyladenine glycosylase [Mollicutes bacterium]|nr:DNA-3-methyladenine glycosylase [Mollicutes bacterium]
MKKLSTKFYTQNVLEVAPQLIGKLLVRKLNDGTIIKTRITETEAYKGEEDTACHARFGKTKRNQNMYESGGITYIYLCYGIHHLLNVITGKKDEPQAVLIRATEDYNGPGKLTKALSIDKTLNGLDLSASDELWIEDDGLKVEYITDKRVGIDYACDYYRNINWRFIMKK